MINIIESSWIPVLCRNGERRIIAPWQIAEEGIVQPDWPRPDLNVACYELLIGLVYMADPPVSKVDWRKRLAADPDRLRKALEPYAPAFNLLGEGPLFLQDFEKLAGDPNPVDMLFIDSAGESTAKKNADLMVHRSRYDALDLPLAAMALYTFQAFAPAGGAGNRTSMRGGGPLVTLADPEADLWDLIWANMPVGQPAKLEDLPWMRPTRSSDKGAVVEPPQTLFNVEAFFGMPRRLRLVSEDNVVTGVIQKPYGTNYAGWKHPLSPYYRMKPDSEWLPKHPRAGHFGYRNWLGVVCEENDNPQSELAYSLRQWHDQGDGGGSVLVAGWSMDNMKPRDFILSRQSLINLPIEKFDRLTGLIRAAEAASIVLRAALAPVLAEGETREAAREEFFRATEAHFLKHARALQQDENPEQQWISELRSQAVNQFEAIALPGLDQRNIKETKQIVDARKFLLGCFSGYSKQGKVLFGALGFEPPATKKGKAA